MQELAMRNLFWNLYHLKCILIAEMIAEFNSVQDLDFWLVCFLATDIAG